MPFRQVVVGLSSQIVRPDMSKSVGSECSQDVVMVDGLVLIVVVHSGINVWMFQTVSM